LKQLKEIFLLIFSWCLLFFTTQAQNHLAPPDRFQLESMAIKLIADSPENANSILSKWIHSYQEQKESRLENLCNVYLAKAFIEMDNSEDAVVILNKLIPNSEPYTEAMALKTLATVDFKNGRFFASTVKIRSAMDLAKANREESLMASLQEDLALVFDKISKPDKAIQFYRRSLQLFTKLNNKSAMQKNALSLGRIYLSLEKLDSAYYFINQSLVLSTQENSTNAFYESKIELANLYYIKKEYASMKEIIQEIDTAAAKPKQDFFNVRLFVLKGNYAMALHSESEALEAFNKAESLSHQGFTPFIDYYIKSNLAEAYYRNGNLSKAYELVKYLNHNSNSYSSKENQKLAESIAKNSELTIRDKEIDYLKIQNQLNEERLKRELMLREGLRRENALKDFSLAQEQQLNAAAIREKTLQAQQLEKEKALSLSLIRENDLRKATLADERNFQAFLWTGIILLMALALLVFYLFRKQQEKNSIILKQTKDLEFVNKEVHHRVKNNLQVISSLLDLQSKYTQDVRFESLLNESKHRVQSMAFIHQNLYESAGMNMVDMPNYIQNLVDHLWTAYQRDGEQVEIEVDVKPMQLHMDLVVSIGMIINELVTNSLKYAFTDRTNGKIRVALSETSNLFQLEVSDNGIGIPESIDVAGANSFGYKMVRAFVQKLKGTMQIARDRGTTIQIQFTKRS
jgi:two-component sensor histidine kinase